MSRRTLNEQQARRSKIAQSDKRRKAQESDRDLSEQIGANLSSEQRGLVICRLGHHIEIEALEGQSQGQIHKCVVRSQTQSLVAGDQVVWRSGADNTGVIESRLPRHSVLIRPDNFGKRKEVAANIDQMLIMVAVKPLPQENLIDRYIVAAELMGIEAIIVLNKIDLFSAQSKASISAMIERYRDLQYRTYSVICSRHKEIALSDLPKKVMDKTSIVVGQSGVGKSSLINALHPFANREVGALSQASGEGRHTTTHARLLHLPNGGKLIDSPGIRDFSLWHIDNQDLTNGFIEIAQHSTNCKFRDCRHKNEPGCAVLSAVEQGLISEERFSSFEQIHLNMQTQKEQFGDY